VLAFCEVVGEGVVVEDKLDKPGDMISKPAFCRNNVIIKAVASMKVTCRRLRATTPLTEMYPRSLGIESTNLISSSRIA
jgi:hypothetical protein